MKISSSVINRFRKLFGAFLKDLIDRFERPFKLDFLNINGLDESYRIVLCFENVDYSATKQEPRKTLAEFGDILRVTIVKNIERPDHSKRAAFIEFTDKKSVNNALNINDKQVKGMN
jgi:RNA recognition motif-containing protein